MTRNPKLWSPPLITETDEPSPWTDCTWSAGLMLWSKATLGKVPATRVEREALRVASGDTIGGSSLYDLRLGIKRRYGHDVSLAPFSGASARIRLARGDGIVLQGIYAALPSHYTRWDTAFAAKGSESTHAVYLQGHDRAGYQHLDSNGLVVDVLILDPLAPHGYGGEWLPWKAAVAYANAFWNSIYLSAMSLAQGQYA